VLEFCERLPQGLRVTLRFIQVAAVLLLFGFAGCNRALDRADLVFINGAEPEPLDPVASTAFSTVP